MSVLVLVLVSKLGLTFHSSYITRIEGVVGLPVSVLILKPTIEWGGERGWMAENFYVSADCVTEDSSITAELGGNCFRTGPLYRKKWDELEIMGAAGILRIDIAGLATGAFAGYSHYGQIDEERTGSFVELKARYIFTDVLNITGFCALGIIKDGRFVEYGANAWFKPFKNREALNFAKQLALSPGLTFAHLNAEIEGKDYPLFFVCYLVGIGYEF